VGRAERERNVDTEWVGVAEPEEHFEAPGDLLAVLNVDGEALEESATLCVPLLQVVEVAEGLREGLLDALPDAEKVPAPEEHCEALGKLLVEKDPECVPLAQAVGKGERDAVEGRVPEGVTVGMLVAVGEEVEERDTESEPVGQAVGGAVLSADCERLADPEPHCVPLPEIVAGTEKLGRGLLDAQAESELMGVEL
jgi:hypothetical protein